MIEKPLYQNYARIFAGVPKPLAYVDLDALNANIEQVLRYSGGKQVRLGSKSIRSRHILRHILQRDQRFNGLLCFSPAEAVWLAQQGFDDLLIAYPTVDSGQIKAVATEVATGRRITLLVDSLAHVELLNAIGTETQTPLPVAIDLDMSTRHFRQKLLFGVYRSTLKTVEAVMTIVEAVMQADFVQLDGVMGYEAQIAGVADNLPRSNAMNRLKRYLKSQSIPLVAKRRAAILDAIIEAGAPLRFVNAGGSGSLISSAAEPGVTEVAAGAAFYAPGLFSYYQDYHFIPAAGFAIEVVRQPAEHIYTCLGGGYVASGEPGADRLPTPYLPEGATLTQFEAVGEVQTPIVYEGPLELNLGAPIFLQHAKAGELCEHFNELYLIADGRIADVVKTYRGEGMSFL